VWLSNLERHVTISKNPYFSKPIDLNKAGVIKFVINANDWSYNDGIADLFMVFERSDVSKGDDYWDRDFKLKVKINAYATDENKMTFPRLVKNYFMPTDEPMSSTTKLWAGWSDARLEYRLGRVLRFPMEDSIIEVSVLVPDAVLAKANPRLKIVGDYDSAVLGHIYTLRLIRGFALILCLASLAVLVFFSWQSVSKKDSEKVDLS
jgi:hypothetical protein